MAARLRAVVVGCNVGRNHAEAYVHSPRTELVALCDLDPAVLDRVADRFDVEARYADFDTMLCEQRPDLVSIATPQQFHAEMTIHAAATHRPKAILCEKGMAPSLGDARAMLAACDRAGVKLAIGHQGRWFSLVERARDLIAAGAIGTPLYARVGTVEGGMLNQSSHAVDRLRFMLNDPDPAWVLANVQRESDRWERGWPCEDLVAGLVGFAGGLRLAVEGDIPASGGAGHHTHVIAGAEGVVIVPLDAQHDTYGLRVLRKGASAWEETPPTGETYQDCRRKEIDALARWAAGEIATHRGDARQAIKTHEILMAMYESARTRGLVRLPLQTMASPLVAMIASGELRVRYPGRHDIRHTGALAGA
ncbi:MAG: Gfo/Idh/MocA family oxidoreductase [Actinobacteria bacterium]|nr:Gfo/Idh/MocA family oxidoreductase [Actinomycetota bacterium]